MAGYAAVVALIVFWPSADVATTSVLGAWGVLEQIGLPSWVGPSSVELAANVLMFMPLGFLGHSFRPLWSWRAWLVVGLAGTLSIELSQAFFLSGRTAQLQDIVSNTLGAVLGYLVAVAPRRG